MKKQKKQKPDIYSFDGFNKGMSSDTDHVIPKGYAKELTNFRFHTKGLKTRYAFKTLEDALPGSFDSSSPSSGGWDSSTYGKFADFVSSDSGKLIVFEGGGVIDTDTGNTWVTASLSAIDMTGITENLLGCLFFADTFLVYTEDHLYSVSTSDGSLTEEVEFSTDVGAEYSPIIKIIPRFGQLWVITQKDRLFWSDVREYSVGASSQETTTIEKEYGVWQMLDWDKLSSIDSVTGYIRSERRIFKHGDEYTRVISGEDYVFVEGQESIFSAGDTGVINGEEKEIKPDGSNQLKLYLASAGAAGDTTVIVEQDMDSGDKGAWAAVSAGFGFDGYPVPFTITETGKDTTHGRLGYRGNHVMDSDAGVVRFALADDLNDDYTTSAVFEVGTIVKIEFTTDFSDTLSHAEYLTEYPKIIPATDYDTSLDPDRDYNAEGHIKLLRTPRTQQAERIVVTYTPTENDWLTDESGYLDINQNYGDNVAAVDGPDYTEIEGSSVIYLFKDNGYVFAIVGKPGPGGSAGSVDIRFMASGLTARSNTLQTTRTGVYFGVFDGVEYKVMFIPHNEPYSMYDITDEYNFDTAIPFDDRDSYTFSEVTGILHGDQYVISFPNATSGLPSSNGELYIGKAWHDRNEGVFKGRWCKLNTNIESEWEDYDSDHTVMGTPVVSGVYRHNSRDYICYYVKTSHDFSGDTRFYEIAQYGQHDGGEECKDKWVMTLDTAGDSSADTTQYCSEYFWAILKSGFVRKGNRMNLRRIFFEGLDVVGGSDGDGIDVTWDILIDLSSTSIGNFPKTASDITDASGNLNLLTEENINFECRNFQVYMKFDNIKYNAHPAYIVVRNIWVEYAPHSQGSILPEENRTY